MTEFATIFSSIIALLGVSSWSAVYLTFRLSKKRFVYEQKLKAYTEFLEAFTQAASQTHPDGNSQVLYQAELLRLLAPDNIYLLAKDFQMRISKNVLVRMPIDTSELISLMKNDLNEST